MYNWHNQIMKFKTGEELKLGDIFFGSFASLLINLEGKVWKTLAQDHGCWTRNFSSNLLYLSQYAFWKIACLQFFWETDFTSEHSKLCMWNELVAWVEKIIYYLFFHFLGPTLFRLVQVWSNDYNLRNNHR